MAGPNHLKRVQNCNAYESGFKTGLSGEKASCPTQFSKSEATSDYWRIGYSRGLQRAGIAKEQDEMVASALKEAYDKIQELEARLREVSEK